MKFEIARSLEILERTPLILQLMLGGLSDEWIFRNEGADTWSPYDIIGHLIHGEKTDWIPRMDIILSDRQDKTFVPFDRFAQFTESKGRSVKELLDQFTTLRQKNLEYLRLKNLSENELNMEGRHPELGLVTLAQLLSAWVVHDLNHLMQISRVMAFQYKDEVGPWQAYMGILNSQLK